MIVGIGVDIAKIRPAARADRAGTGPGCPLFAKREHSRAAKALAGPSRARAESAMPQPRSAARAGIRT